MAAAEPQQPSLIAVCGATGKQGGSVVDALLARGGGRFAVRGVSRNATSPKAKALASRGVELACADFDDPASLRRAFDGAHGAFCVTNFWQDADPSHEVRQAAALADACAAAGVRHAIWSTLEDTRVMSPPGQRMPAIGAYSVPHFDGKGEADDLFRKSGVPTTFLRTSFFFDNFLPAAGLGLAPRRAGPGQPLVLSLPMPRGAKLAGIAVADIGGCAAGIFLDPDATIGKTIGIAGDHLSGEEYADAFSKVLRVDVSYEAVDVQTYRASGAPGAEDMANMFQYYADFEAPFLAARDLAATRRLNPQLRSFEAWLREHEADFAQLL